MKKSIKFAFVFVFSLFISLIVSSCTIFGSDKYTISFNTNGGSSIASIELDWKDEIVLPEDPTRTGYTFAGWYIDQYLTTQFVEGTIAETDIVIYAKWNVNQYTVSFNTNGGSEISSITANYNSSITIPETTKEGYSFINWYNEETFENTFNKVMPAKDVTVYAKFVANEATFKFEGGEGATGSMNNVSIVTGKNTKLPENLFTKEGYSFVNWKNLATGDVYDDLATVNIVKENGSVTLTAQWKVNQYYVNFVNDGVSYQKDENLDYNSKVVLPTSNPSLNGYTFEGWGVMEETTDEVFDISKQYFTLANGIYSRASVNYGSSINGTYYNVSIKDEYYVTVDGLDLYAKYIRNQYSISYNSNGGSEVASENNYFATSIVEPTKPTKTGYTFAGWYSDAEFKNLYVFSTMPANNLNLYAKWTINQYTISFDSNGGSSVNSIKQDYNSAVVAPNDPTRTGYTFAGWDKDVPSTMPANNLELKASWTINQYTISFDVDGGSEIASIKQDYNSQVTAPNNPTRTGYTFAGWDKTIPSTMPANDVEIKASWTINQYTISFDSNGGSKVSSIKQDYNSEVTAPEDPTRTGYTFAGWDKDVPSTMPANNLELKASWTINQYTISFDANGGSDVTSIKQDYNSAITAPNNPTRTGYTFAGWDKVIPSTMPANDVEIKASWTINQYTISFDSNGGSKVSSIKQDYNSAVVAPAEPTRTGYTFAGWDKDVPETMPANDVELKASWTINQYTISFDANGGSEVTSIKQDYNTAITAPNNPTRTGYTFAGWDKVIPSTMPANDVEIKATWTINQYTITFDSNGGSAVASITQDYNSAITAPNNPTRTGYTFAGWSETVPTNMPSENKTLTASWNANTDTAYKVKHYKEKLDGTYELAETDNLSGTTDTNTNATSKTYNGFTLKNSISQINIEADGSSIVNVYYDRNTYTVSFKENTTLIVSVNAIYGDSLKTLPTELVKTGYNYILKVDSLTFTSSTIIEEDVEVTVTYEVKSVSISFYNYPESENPDIEEIIQAYNTDVTLPTATKTGYTFKGWYTASTGGEKSEVDKMPATALDLYARWEINQYTITFDSNGGSAVDSITQDFDTAITAPANPTKTGYTFAGWDKSIPNKMQGENITITASWNVVNYNISYALSGGTNNEDNPSTYTIEDAITLENPTRTGYSFVKWTEGNTIALGSTDAKTFTAEWQVVTYTISYVLDNGTNNSNNPSSYTIESSLITLQNPTKTGYTFEGWTEGNNILAGSTGNKTFTAEWTAIDYVITYVLNGGENHEDNPSTYTIEDAITLENPSRTGYLFVKWTEGSSISLGSTDAKTFTAEWQVVTYTISYVLDNGTNNSNNPSSYTIESSLITLQNPTKTGYTFEGWTEGNNILAGSTGNKTFTAEWTAIDYVITYVLNGGENHEDNPSTYTIEDAITLENPSKEGYTFVKWTEGSSIALGSTDAKTFTAEWQIVTYTITYVLNGGTNHQDNPSTYNVESSSITILNPSKDGYDFLSFNEGNTIAAGSTGNKTFTANWSPKTYTISYVLGGGTNNSDNPSTYTIEDAITLKNPSKEGHTFVKWTEGSSIALGSTGSKTFTAEWQVNTYKITFVLTNADSGLNELSANFGASISAPNPNPTKRGYAFAGWFEDDGFTIPYVFTTMPAKNFYLYPKFDPVYYSLSFINDNNGNVISSLKMHESFDEDDIFVSKYVKNEYDKMNAYEYIRDGIQKAVQSNLTSNPALANKLTGIVTYANIMTLLHTNVKAQVLNGVEIDESDYNLLDEYSQKRIQIDLTIKSKIFDAAKAVIFVNVVNQVCSQSFDLTDYAGASAFVANLSAENQQNIMGAVNTYAPDEQTAIIAILASKLSNDQIFAAELYSNLSVAFDVTNSSDLEYLKIIAGFASCSDQTVYLEDLSSLTSGKLTVTSYNYYQLKTNAYNPVKPGYVFDGWQIYENYSEGVARLTATWIKQIESPKHLDQQSMSKNSVTVKWDEVANAYGYKVYVKRNGAEEFTQEGGIISTTNAVINVSENEIIEVYVIALFKDNNGTYQQYSNSSYTTATSFEDGSEISIEQVKLDSEPSNIFHHEHKITSDTDISVDKVEDYYYYNKTDGDFYFFTGLMYSMPSSTTNVELLGNGSDLAYAEYDGSKWVIYCKSAAGEFDFNITNGEGTNSYHATINYLVSEITYGEQFNTYVNANNYLNSNKELYVIGTAKIGDTSYDYLTYNAVLNEVEYYNGFHFDFDIVTTSAISLDSTLFKLTYKFYGYDLANEKYKDTELDSSFVKYDEDKDAFFFLTNDYSKYKVVACAKIDESGYTNTKIPNVYKNNDQYKVSFEFKLNDGVNVFNHEELTQAYRYEINASNINVHSNITAYLKASMAGYYQYFIDCGKQTSLSGSTVDQTDPNKADRGELDIVDYSAVMVSSSENPSNKYGPNCWVVGTESSHVFVAKDGTYYQYQQYGSFAIKSCEYISNPYKGLFKMVGGSASSDNRSIDLDVSSVYTRQDFVGQTDKPAITVNGNMFTIDASKIPCLQSGINNKVGLTGHLPTYTIQSTNCAIFTCDTDSTMTIKNLTMIGNTQDASSYLTQGSGNVKSIADYMDYTSGGLCGIRIEPRKQNSRISINDNKIGFTGYDAHMVLDNVIISNTTIAVYYDYTSDADVKYTTIKQSWANSVYSHGGGDLRISNSQIETSGGAAIHIEDVFYTLKNTYVGTNVITNPSMFIDYINTIVSNNVSGEEQWFKAYGMEITALGMKSMLDSNIKNVNLHLSVLTNYIDPVTGAESEKINLVYLSKNDNIYDQADKDESDLFVDFIYGDSSTVIVDSSSVKSAIYHSDFANSDMVVEQNISGANTFYIFCSKDVYKQCAKNIRLQVYENVKAQVLPNFGNDANTAKGYIDEAYGSEDNAKAACLAYCLDNSNSVLSLNDEEREYFVNNYYYYILAANVNASNNMQYVESVVDSNIRENCSKLAMSLGYTKNYLKFRQSMGGEYTLEGMVEVYYKN